MRKHWSLSLKDVASTLTKYRGVDPFFGLGPGARVRKKNQNFRRALRGKSQYKILQNRKWCMFSSIFMLNLMFFQGLAVLFKPIRALHITNCSSCQNYWGGGGAGGGQNNIFMGWWGATAGATPPPPRIDASAKIYIAFYDEILDISI